MSAGLPARRERMLLSVRFGGEFNEANHHPRHETRRDVKPSNPNQAQNVKEQKETRVSLLVESYNRALHGVEAILSASDSQLRKIGRRLCFMR